jgi:PAS domain S-box-containing protein
VRYEHGISKKDAATGLAVIGTVFGLVVCTVVLWNAALKRKVTERTAELDLTNTRLEAEMDQRLSTEEALEASRDYLYNLTNSMVDVVISVRFPERRIEWVNDAIRKLGYTPDECIGRTTEFIYADRNDFMALGSEMTRAISGNRDDIVTEFMFQKKNGDIFPAEITISFFQEKGQIVSITGIVRDISERKEKERQLDDYQQRLKALATQLTMAEEKERRRIASELHDQVAQALTFARIRLATAQRTPHPTIPAAILEDVSRYLLKAMQDTRHLISELSSPTMKEIGLGAGIREWLEEHMPQHGIQAEFIDQTDGDWERTLAEDVRLMIYRNVRELLTNVVKHADAGRVTVRMFNDVREFCICVEDDGRGFQEDPAAVGTGGQHFGIFSIRERMAQLGGMLEMASAPGSGCRAVLRLAMPRTSTAADT